MTVSIVKKIAMISAKLPSLKKEDENKFQKYKFVSIDDYYEKVASQITAGGVFWVTTELSSIVHELENSVIIITKYEFNVFDTEDDENSIVIHLSVAHPFQGAQTAGSSLSYADKLFMRSVFKVVTGEQDADASDAIVNARVKQGVAGSVAPRNAPTPDGDHNAQTAKLLTQAEDLYYQVVDAFDKAVTVEDLASTLVRERKNLSLIRTDRPDLHAKLQAYYHDSIKHMDVKDNQNG